MLSFKLYCYKYHPELYKKLIERENISKLGTIDQNKTYRLTVKKG